jgi:CcmD family protein
MSPTAAVSQSALFYVMAVNLVIWAGLFGYVFYLDRKVRTAMARRQPEEARP